jgi:energy-coupling factor transporter transmembrane protein EcfT
MMNLTFVLFPVIFDKFAEMMAAQKARCVELRKNKIKRIIFTAAPLLSQTLRKAEEIAYAMESRCYTEERTKAVFQTKPQDWFFTAICVGIFIAIVF